MIYIQILLLLTISSQSCHHARLSGPHFSDCAVFKSQLVVQLLELPVEAKEVHRCGKGNKQNKKKQKTSELLEILNGQLIRINSSTS